MLSLPYSKACQCGHCSSLRILLLVALFRQLSLVSLFLRFGFRVHSGEIGRGLRPRREHGHRNGHHQREEYPQKAMLSPRHRLGSPCGRRHRRLRHGQ